jgi:hypothetical protein
MRRRILDVGFWKKAAHLKARGCISLADAFAVTLAERNRRNTYLGGPKS